MTSNTLPYLLTLLIIGGANPALAGDRPVAMLPLEAPWADPTIAEAIENVVLQSAHDVSTQKILGAADIRAMLDVKILQQAAGCEGDEVSCLTEIGNALGVSHVLKIGLTTLSGQLILSLTLIDQHKSSVLSREQVVVPRDESLYAEAVTKAVVGVFREAGLARPPSRRLEKKRSTLGTTGWSLVGGAIAMVAAGSVVLAMRPGLESIETNEYLLYQNALTQEEADAAYQDVRGSVDDHNTLTTVGWVLFGAGTATAIAALVVFYLRPTKEDIYLSLSPGPGGGALWLGGRF